MKKYLIIACASLIALVSCVKEKGTEELLKPTDGAVLTFTSAKPQLTPDTKTAWDGTTVVWSDDDKIKVGFTFNDAWWAQTAAYSSENESPNNRIKFYQSSEVSIADESQKNVGTFNVPTLFSVPAEEGDFVFYALYPSSLIDNNADTAPDVTVPLKTTQTPAEDSFDATTDIMVATSAVITSTGLPTDPIELFWKRVVAHVDLTFSNMGFVGTEIPQKITLTFNEDAKVAGSFSVNISDATITTGSTNEIVLQGNGLSVNGSSINTWATVLPVSFTSLDVEVKTDKATYTRSISGLSKTFKKNARNTLTVNMANANRTALAATEWVKKALSDITSSDVFVIVGNNGNNYAMSNGNGTGSAPAAVAVTVTTENKLATAPADNIQWTLSGNATNGYTFYPNGTTETWLYCTNTNNGVRVGTNDNKAFILDQSGYLKNTATNRFVGIYNSENWRCYTSTGVNINGQTFAFYVKSAPDTRNEAELSFANTSFDITVGDDFTAPTLTNPHNLTVTYSSSDEDLAVVDETTGEVVLGDDAGTVTITASFAGNTSYKPGEASYTITILPDANDGSLEHPYTASEARDLALNGDTGSYYISGIVTKVQNQFDANHGTANFWIDENGTAQNVFEGYKIKYFGNVNWVAGNATIAVDDEVVIYGTLTIYNNSVAETSSGYLVSLNGKTKGLSLAAPTVTTNDSDKQITIAWTAATGTESAISYVVSCGTQSYNATTAGSHTFTMADYGTYNVSVVATAIDAVSGTATTTATISDPSSSTPTLQYTLDGTTTGGTNAYAEASDINQSSISWKVTGNTTVNPWRVGGKNLTQKDRTIYSTKPISSNISSIEVESGTATAAVNSLTISVHSSAAEAASGSNAIATKTVTTGITSSTVILSKTDNTSWAGKYYRIVYNVTTDSSNQYVQFKSAKFYGTN